MREFTAKNGQKYLFITEEEFRMHVLDSNYDRWRTPCDHCVLRDHVKYPGVCGVTPCSNGLIIESVEAARVAEVVWRLTS